MKTKYTNIRVLVARSLEAVDAGSCDDVRDCDTVVEAKKFARYSLTAEYQASCEMSEPMNYARVMVCENGADVCLADYFRRGYVPPVKPENAEDDIPAGNLAGDDAKHLGDDVAANWEL